jgi:hypothetical protein
MRHDSHTVTFRPLAAAVLTALGLPLALGACASAPLDPEVDPAANAAGPGSDGAGCRVLVGRYVDAGRPDTPEGRGPAPVRTETLAEVLGLDPSTGASVPVDERAVEVLHVAGDRYSLSIGKTTQPDAVSLWDTPATCAGSELQLQTASRYESADGVHVTRQKMKVTIYADADGTLVVRRALSERAIGLIDLRRGGNGNVDRFRFARLEGRPAR